MVLLGETEANEALLWPERQLLQRAPTWQNLIRPVPHSYILFHPKPTSL